VDAELTIRAARDSDGAALVALIKPIFEEYEGVLFIDDEMPELGCIATTFGDAGGSFWCAFRHDALVGSVGWTPAKVGNGIELKKLYVAQRERRHGLGGLLTAKVEDAARARGADFVELWSDVKFTTAHRFYQRRGYLRGPHTRLLHDQSNTEEYPFRLAIGANANHGD
jgi:putative acetyltransferase